MSLLQNMLRKTVIITFIGYEETPETMKELKKRFTDEQIENYLEKQRYSVFWGGKRFNFIKNVPVEIPLDFAAALFSTPENKFFVEGSVEVPVKKKVVKPPVVQTEKEEYELTVPMNGKGNEDIKELLKIGGDLSVPVNGDEDTEVQKKKRGRPRMNELISLDKEVG